MGPPAWKYIQIAPGQKFVCGDEYTKLGTFREHRGECSGEAEFLILGKVGDIEQHWFFCKTHLYKLMGHGTQ